MQLRGGVFAMGLDRGVYAIAIWKDPNNPIAWRFFLDRVFPCCYYSVRDRDCGCDCGWGEWTDPTAALRPRVASRTDLPMIVYPEWAS